MGKLGVIPNINCKYAKWYISGNRKVAMRSGYEVAYAFYLDSLQLAWQYEPKTFFIGGKSGYRGKTYTPDFFVINTQTFVEIKGRLLVRDKNKMATFAKLYPQYKFVILIGAQFRNLVGRTFMAMGGTAPQVTSRVQINQMATLNSRITFR
jgi:hypothetical protein